MNKPILVDTDVMVDFLRGYPEAVSLVQKHSTQIILSSIVVAELYAGVRGEEELTVLDRFISLFPIIPISSGIARAGGLYRRDYLKSDGVGLADAIIAAVADSEDADLITLNVKHYPMFRNLKPAYRKTPQD